MTEREEGCTIEDSYGVIEEGGRKYQVYGGGEYDLPHDGDEQNRLDIQNAMWKLLLGDRMHLAPIQEHPARVLDIATGTGIWANEFAELHPDCQVVGTDLSLIQPYATPNVMIFREDSEKEEWTYPGLFDYVHLRSTLISFTDVRAIMRKAHNFMQPGGWIEFQDFTWDVSSYDGSHQGTGIERYSHLVQQSMASTGREFSMARLRTYPQLLTEAGFMDVRLVNLVMPANGWIEWDSHLMQLGMWMALAATNAVESYRRIVARTGLSEAEIDVAVAEAKEDLANRDLHCFFPGCIIYARKPDINETVELDIDISHVQLEC